MSLKNLIVVVRPTAVGKTAASIELALYFKCPVISADSRQFYKELSIGTAKPSVDEMQGVPHYFIDSHSISEEYNVGKFEREVLLLLADLFKEYDDVIMVGGSGLYIDAVCKGFDELPESNPEIRNKIDLLFKNQGIEGLQQLLKELDEVYYQVVDLNNPQRLSRALEVCLTTGKPYSQYRKGVHKKRDFNIIKIGLDLPREELYNRINTRVDSMMDCGLLEEVKSVKNYRQKNALQTVGYKELFDYLDGSTVLNTAVELIKQNTRRFAKRQLTWFRRDDEIQWFAPDQSPQMIQYIKEKRVRK
jgi:tRNA dimethylallyltransferase